MKKAAESAVKHKIQDFLYENVTAKWQKTEHNGDIWKNIQKIIQATALHCAKAYRVNSYTLSQVFLSAITAFK